MRGDHEDRKLLSRRVLEVWSRLSKGAPITASYSDAVMLGAVLRNFERRPVDESYEPSMHFAARWAQFGHPTFTLSSSLAAAFVLTDISKVDRESFRMPFDSFSIQLPQPLLFMTHPEYVEPPGAPLLMMDCHCFSVMENDSDIDSFLDGVPDLKALPQGLKFQPSGSTRKKYFFNILGKRRERTPVIWCEQEFPTDDREISNLPENTQAATCAAMRIFVNMCLFINARRTEADGSYPVPQEFMRDRKSAKHWVLGKSVKLPRPLHEAARQFAETGKRTAWQATSRWVVRGHWRNQVCGPRRQERRLTWVEPYWKGPADAVAAVERKYEVEQTNGKIS